MEQLELFHPLTLPQQEIYYDQLLNPKSPKYNIGAKIEIQGPLNIDALKFAYKKLIDQHDSYRICLTQRDRIPLIKIHPSLDLELQYIDYSNKKSADKKINHFIDKEFKKTFNLFNDKLLHKFILFKINKGSFVLFNVYHHIITDGWGTSLMFQRLVQNYNELVNFGKVISSYPYSYINFIKDDLNYQKSKDFLLDKQYWKKKFKNIPTSLIPQITENLNISKREKLCIERTTYNKIISLSNELRVSTFHIILGMFFVYFSRYYNNSDFGIGIPVLNRKKSLYKKTVGLFMGLNPLRLQINYEDSFKDIVFKIKNELRSDYRHQRFPVGKLIQELNLYKEKEKLFNITLSYEKQDYSNHFKNTTTNVLPLTHGAEGVALAIYIREFNSSEDVIIDFDYNISFLNNYQINSLLEHFQTLILDVLNNRNKKLKQFNLFSENERENILNVFNKTNSEIPKVNSIIDLFEEQVNLKPFKTAISDGCKIYSYSELNKLSNQIAYYIDNILKWPSKKPIAIMLKRSSDLVGVLLGILKSGRSFIPLDPSFPSKRLCYILKHSKCKYLISEKMLIKGLNLGELSVINIDSIINSEILINYNSTINKFDTAYIIYTSGSTGNPKGVEIQHNALLNFLCSIIEKPGISENDILYAVTTYSFDISLLELFLPIISGATIEIATEDTLSDPFKIITELNHKKPTVIQATPSFFQMLFNAGWKGGKQLKVLCGGDILSKTLAKKLIATTQELWNMYGPTETTIWSTLKRVLNYEEYKIIGKPINNTQVYILDEWLNPVPIGAYGNIFIGGNGLAKGYFGDKSLTEERFIDNPFINNTKIYNTGDLGKWTQNGEIEFLGRNDLQVKLRGFRIELTEIEKKLTSLDFIDEAVVVVQHGKTTDAFLVAYIKSKIEPSISHIISSLEKSLPHYMIPKAIIKIDDFPLTPNNKIDRKTLTNKDIENTNFIDYNSNKTPNNKIELVLLKLWKKALNLNNIGTSDNFFHIGGHSIKAIEIIHSINEEFSCNLNLKDLFDNPTIIALAKAIENSIKNKKTKYKIPQANKKSFYDLTTNQKNIWFLSQRKKSSIAYNMNAAFQLKGNINIDLLDQSTSHIIKNNESLRTNFIEVDGIPKQIIIPFKKVQFKTQIHKLNHINEIDNSINSITYREFDLENAPLIRLDLIKYSNDQIVLIFSAHHIIMDGWSIELFIDQLVKNYNNLVKNKSFINENIELQYKDYSEWLNYTKKDYNLQQYWNAKLMDYNYSPSFKRDFHPQEKTFSGDIFQFTISKNQTVKLKKMAQSHNKTLFSILVTLLKTLIYKYSNVNDICIGVISSGRFHFQLKNLMGLLASTMPLRTQYKPNGTFLDHLKDISESITELFSIENSHNLHLESLFDVLIVFQNPNFSYNELNNLKNINVTPFPIQHQTSRFPLTFDFYEEGQFLNCNLEFSTDLYQKETIILITEKFKKLISEVIENVEQKVIDLDITLDVEKQKQQDIDIDFNF